MRRASVERRKPPPGVRCIRIVWQRAAVKYGYVLINTQFSTASDIFRYRLDVRQYLNLALIGDGYSKCAEGLWNTGCNASAGGAIDALRLARRRSCASCRRSRKRCA